MIEISVADITRLEVDAIVNAANRSLLGGGGVDGAIHRAAGPELLDYNRYLGGCETGKAKISPGFNCPATWIIHTVGPVWKGGDDGEPDLLMACYQSSFQLALEKQLNSIAFPAISTGVYGYPKESAATIAIKIMKQYETDIDRIIACCFCDEDKALYELIINSASK